jgi:hypothetical protein
LFLALVIIRRVVHIPVLRVVFLLVVIVLVVGRGAL